MPLLSASPANEPTFGRVVSLHLHNLRKPLENVGRRRCQHSDCYTPAKARVPRLGNVPEQAAVVGELLLSLVLART